MPGLSPLAVADRCCQVQGNASHAPQSVPSEQSSENPFQSCDASSTSLGRSPISLILYCPPAAHKHTRHSCRSRTSAERTRRSSPSGVGGRRPVGRRGRWPSRQHCAASRPERRLHSFRSCKTTLLGCLGEAQCYIPVRRLGARYRRARSLGVPVRGRALRWPRHIVQPVAQSRVEAGCGSWPQPDAGRGCGSGRSEPGLPGNGPVGSHPAVRCRCSLRRLCAVLASSHSLWHAVKPRRDIMVKFWQVFSCPNTGSTVRARIL